MLHLRVIRVNVLPRVEVSLRIGKNLDVPETKTYGNDKAEPAMRPGTARVLVICTFNIFAHLLQQELKVLWTAR